MIDPMQSRPQGSSPLIIVIVALIAIVAGIGTGYLLKGKSLTPKTGTTMTGSSTSSDISDEKAVETAGIKNESAYKDKTEGILKEGGIEGEGTYHLERPGGISQTAYLTSTTVDLEPFIGKKIRVWGKTFQGKKAGWLMDVGYVEALQ